MELLWWVFLAETTSSNTLKACVAAKPAPWARPAAATYRGRAALLPGTQQLTRFSLPQLTVLLLGGTRRNEAGRDLRARSCQKMPQAHAAMHKPSAWHALPLALGPGLGAGASSQAGQSPPAPLPVTLHVLQAMQPESSHGAACKQRKRAERGNFQPTVRHQTGLQKSFGSKDNTAGLRAR